MKVKLTDHFARTVKPTGAKRDDYQDTGEPRLWLRVHPPSAKRRTEVLRVFWFWGSAGGKDVYERLGEPGKGDPR